MIALPVAVHGATVRIRAATSRLEAATGTAPTEEQLVEATCLPPDRVRRALASRHQVVSLDARFGSDAAADARSAVIPVAQDSPADRCG